MSLFKKKLFGFVLEKNFLTMVDVIIQLNGIVDPNKGLIHKCIKATSISHMNILSSQDL
jgi:hypothetical protein